MNAILVQFISH